jgi:hypothetical protein
MGLTGIAIAAALSGIFTLTLKTIVGEKYYKCINGYLNTIFTISILIFVVFVNYFLYEYVYIKNTIFILGFIIVLITHKQEIMYLKNLLSSFIKKR